MNTISQFISISKNQFVYLLRVITPHAYIRIRDVDRKLLKNLLLYRHCEGFRNQTSRSDKKSEDYSLRILTEIQMEFSTCRTEL